MGIAILVCLGLALVCFIWSWEENNQCVYHVKAYTPIIVAILNILGTLLIMTSVVIFIYYIADSCKIGG